MTNYKIYVNGWCCEHCFSIADAIEKGSVWVRMGYEDVTIHEVASGTEWNHNPSRKDRF